MAEEAVEAGKTDDEWLRTEASGKLLRCNNARAFVGTMADSENEWSERALPSHARGPVHEFCRRRQVFLSVQGRSRQGTDVRLAVLDDSISTPWRRSIWCENFDQDLAFS